MPSENKIIFNKALFLVKKKIKKLKKKIYDESFNQILYLDLSDNKLPTLDNKFCTYMIKTVKTLSGKKIKILGANEDLSGLILTNFSNKLSINDKITITFFDEYLNLLKIKNSEITWEIKMTKNI